MHKPHKLALMLPPMTADEREALKRDIEANGLLEPITLYEDKVLDGIHRQAVCDELAIDPAYTTYDGPNPAAFVVSKNLHRRHLTAGQRAALGAELLPALEREAKKRQVRKPADSVVLNRSQQTGKARDDAAKIVNVGGSTIQKAKRLKQEAPDLFERVKAGDLTLNAAGSKIKKKPAVPPKRKRSPNWNGKSNTGRARELADRKRKGNYPDLLNFQVQLNRMCVLLQGWHGDDFDLDDATLALVADVHDDLVSLGEWYDRTLSAVQAWLMDADVLAKIEKLERVNGRPGPEAETALRLAARLRRKLETRLET